MHASIGGSGIRCWSAKLRWRIFNLLQQPTGAIILNAQHELLFVTRERYQYLRCSPVAQRVGESFLCTAQERFRLGDIRDDSARFNVELDRYRCDCRIQGEQRSSKIDRVLLAQRRHHHTDVAREFIGKRQAAANRRRSAEKCPPSRGEQFDLAPPYTVTLCEADPASKECKEGNAGIAAQGVGGLLLPLRLHVTELTVSRQSQAGDSWVIDASVRSRVDAISPLCQTAHGQIISRENNTISVQLEHFYCNWVVVGNVLVNADLSIDNISLKDKVFTGFYKVTFHGTGNAAGSGYYRAVIVPKI